MLRKRTVLFLVGLCILGLLAGCSSSPSKPEVKPTTTQTTSAPAPAPTPAPAPATKSAPQTTKALEIVKGWTWTNDDGDYDYIRGSVKNVGDQPISYFEVTAEYLDENGNVLDTEYTNCGETVRPGNQKKFEIMHATDPQEKKVRIFVNKVSFR